ncbi:LysR family transcriptional regulator substrate-binding protein, partial [Plesiomonas sp.]|uniref:LysR family transcriptional regulator substrate-binding protein n=1 Tax=Plesiomonas sp. TaxID=2486279 RepID=UPI003F392A34
CALGEGLLFDEQTDTVVLATKQAASAELPTLILLGHDTRTRALIDVSLQRLSLPPVRVMEVGSVDAQIDWAEAGFGVAIVPEFSLHPKLNLRSRITPLPRFSTTHLGYIVRQNQILSRAVKQLLRWVDEEISSSN